MEDFSRTSRAAAEAAEEQAKSLKELEKTSRDLAASADTLGKALKEQAEDGDLSLKTALDLIDAGYGAALVIDTETGAVTLNRAAALKDGDTTAIEAQIAALKQARAELQSFTGASEAAGRASSSRAKKAQTAAQIYKYDKALADSEASLWAEQTETLTNELEERVRGIESQRQGMERALSGYGELFTVKDDLMSLESIQEQIDAINRYEEAMTRLRERGLSQDLLDEVLAMNVDEATAYGEQLLAMSDSQWEQYNALWDEKQLRAAQVAEQFYKDQLQELETEYNARLDEALDGLTDTAFQSGVDTARGLIEGLASQEEALYAKARAMEQEVARIWKDAWKDIPSNAEIAASLNPEAMRTEPPATATDVRGAVAAGVNGIQTALAGIGAESAGVTGAVYLDGQQVGRVMLPGLRAEARANPEVVDDT